MTTSARLLLALAGFLAVAACSDDGDTGARASDPAEFAAESAGATSLDDGPSDDENTNEDDEDDLIDPTDIPGDPVNKFDLDVGDCFDMIEGRQDGRPVTITTRLACDEPHSNEIYHETLYPAAHPATFPGDTAMRQYALEICYRAFESWVGVEYELSELDIDVIVPTQENFEDSAARYRGIHCWVERFDGEPLESTTRGWGR